MPRTRILKLSELEVSAFADNLKQIADSIETGKPLKIIRLPKHRAVDTPRALRNHADWLIRKLLVQNGGKHPLQAWDFDKLKPKSRERRIDFGRL